MKEEYKKLKDFSRYRIYPSGKILSEKFNKILKDTNDGRGYRQVTLIDDFGQRRTVKVHILIAKTWLPNPNNYKEVNHIDKHKAHNNVENLEWCDRSYNVSFSSLENQLSKQKALSPMTEEMVRFIPIMMSYKFSIKLIASLYKVGHITIRNIIKGKTWKNLNLTFPPKTYYNSGQYKRGIVEVPEEIYRILKSFNVDNTVLNSKVKILESV